MADVQAFSYRNPRFTLALPVRFCVEHAAIEGVTCNISEDGLLVRLQEPVLPGTEGRVRLEIERCFLELGARVAYAHLFEIGLKFDFASSEERAFVMMLVRVVSRNLHRAGRPITGNR